VFQGVAAASKFSRRVRRWCDALMTCTLFKRPFLKIETGATSYPATRIELKRLAKKNPKPSGSAFSQRQTGRATHVGLRGA
jgi:hypothetical protein